MVRYLLTAASVFALLSGVALAETAPYGSRTVVVTHGSPHVMGHGARITKRYINHEGKVVTKSKTFREGFSGSSVTRTKKVYDPYAGTITKSRSTTE